MSVVAIKKYDDYIEICADGLAIRGSYNVGQCNKNSCKLFTDKNNYILGSVGYLSDGELFNTIISKSNIIKFISIENIDLLKCYDLKKEFYDKLLQQILYKNAEKFDERVDGSRFIIIINNKIFEISSNCITNIETFSAIGAGSNEVISDLINGCSPTEAVKKSAKSNIYISEPITTYRYYFNREDNKIEEVK
jgi:hypothetical protein